MSTTVVKVVAIVRVTKRGGVREPMIYLTAIGSAN